jgi:hypothetical protein
MRAALALAVGVFGETLRAPSGLYTGHNVLVSSVKPKKEGRFGHPLGLGVEGEFIELEMEKIIAPAGKGDHFKFSQQNKFYSHEGKRTNLFPRGVGSQWMCPPKD